VLRTATSVPVVDGDVIGFAAFRPVTDFRRSVLDALIAETVGLRHALDGHVVTVFMKGLGQKATHLRDEPPGLQPRG
jgi:hypothetical protein